MIVLVGFAVLVVMFASWLEPVQVIKQELKLEKIRFAWILSCAKCLGFWSALIYFQNPFKAGIVSLLAYIISHIIDQIENWYQK